MRKGFSLVEILIVIAIIAILASTILVRLNTAREKAQIAKAKADMRELRTAIDLLAMDTELLPNALPEEPCVQNPLDNEVLLDTPAAGIEATDGSFPGWNGPYMNNVPTDVWGNSYVFDTDYDCTASPIQEGCEDFTGQTVRAIHSPGPNGSPINAYDSDDVVFVLCS